MLGPFRKNIRKIFGIYLSGIGLVWSVVKLLLDFLGDLDFVIERVKDPGWMQEIYNHVVSFSPEGNMAIFIISLCLFAYFMKYPKNEMAAEVSTQSTVLIDPPSVAETEAEHIASLIQSIRDDANINRLFLDLIYGRKDTHPSIISVWRGDATRLLYIGQNAGPTDGEKKEKTALAWILSNGLAEPVQIAPQREVVHSYFITPIGQKVKEKYEKLYPHENRNFRG